METVQLLVVPEAGLVSVRVDPDAPDAARARVVLGRGAREKGPGNVQVGQGGAGGLAVGAHGKGDRLARDNAVGRVGVRTGCYQGR